MIVDLTKSVWRQKNDMKHMESQMKDYTDQLMNEICELKYENNKTIVENVELNAELEQMSTDLARFIPEKARNIARCCDLDQLIERQKELRSVLAIYESELMKRVKDANLCRICMNKYDKRPAFDRQKMVIVPCGHCVCKKCVIKDLTYEGSICPWCRADVDETIAVWD